MKKISIIFVSLLVSSILYSQKTIAYADPDIFYYKDYSIFIKNAVSTKDYTKFRIKIMNKSDGVMIFKPEETFIVYSDRKENPISKEFSISPNDKEAKTIIFEKKGNRYNEKSIALILDGLYIKRNTFDNGEIVVKLEKQKKIVFSFTEAHSEIISTKKINQN